MRRTLVVAVAALCTVSEPAWAQVNRFPTGLNVSVLRPSAININWLLTGAAGSTAQSTIGLFQLDDPGAGAGAGACVEGTAIGAIRTTVTTSVTPTGTARAVETLVIPSTVADRALKLGRNQFFYCRVFTGSFGTARNRVTCRQGSSAFATFSVSRVELFFENRRREVTVPVGHTLRLFADVAYNGSGLLRAVWEIAETGVSDFARGIQVNAPPTTFSTEVPPQQLAPATFFRTLHVINQFVSFGDRLLLTMPAAPPLPTSQPGSYTVNLRFIEPAVGFAIPVARYFVESREPTRTVAPIALREPGDGARVSATPFAFRWQPAPNATHYRFEVYPQEVVKLPPFPGLVAGPATQPAEDSSVFVRVPREEAGEARTISALIPSQVTSYLLRADQVKKLQAGRSYLWRVTGVDASGNVVAESAIQQFTVRAR